MLQANCTGLKVSHIHSFYHCNDYEAVGSEKGMTKEAVRERRKLQTLAFLECEASSMTQYLDIAHKQALGEHGKLIPKAQRFLSNV